MRKSKSYIYISLLLILLTGLSSCKTKQLVPKRFKKLPEAPAELIAMTRHNNVNYQSLLINQFKVRYSAPDNSMTFYGAAKIQHDSLILVSIRAPLGIELSRILLTPDSVKMINRPEKKVILSDYSYIENRLKVDMNFYIIESLISGNFPVGYELDQRTLMQRSQQTDTIENMTYIGSYYNTKKRDNLKFQAWIYPENIKTGYYEFYKKRNMKLFDVLISEYMHIDGDHFPESLEIRHTNSKGLNSEIQITFNSFERIKNADIHFDVPSKYKVIRLN